MKGHIDIFSGIGGFALACKWAGIETEVFCEKDEKCRSFLERTYPGIPILPDIREFDGTKWRGRFILTGGVPCQPASRAGKQRGKGDDRWLWPEAIRVISEARPTWALLENPLGIEDVGFDGILADLESHGYQVQPICLPACAVNSPHIRQRVWIVANAKRGGSDGKAVSVCGEEPRQISVPTGSGQGNMADTESQRRERQDHETTTGKGGRQKQDGWVPKDNNGDLAHPGVSRENALSEGLRPWDSSTGESIGISESYVADTDSNGELREGRTQAEQDRDGQDRGISYRGHWDSYLWTPCADGKLRRTPGDSFGLVDGLHRSVLAALGNSIVPQVAYQIISAIKETEEVVIW